MNVAIVLRYLIQFKIQEYSDRNQYVQNHVAPCDTSVFRFGVTICIFVSSRWIDYNGLRVHI